MSPRIDFSGVTEFKAIPEGTYPCVFSAFKYVEQAKSSGQPYIELNFTVSEGEHAGRKLYRNYSLQPQSLWAIKNTLITLGVAPEAFADEGGVEISDLCNEAIGATCAVQVKVHEYQGADRNDVTRVLAKDLSADEW